MLPLLLLTTGFLRSDAEPLSTLEDISHALEAQVHGKPFSVRVRVIVSSRPERKVFYAEDDTQGLWFGINDKLGHIGEMPGDTLVITGVTTVGKSGFAGADCLYAKRQCAGNVPAPRPMDYDLLTKGFPGSQYVSVEGTVREIFRDEIDPVWVYALLNCHGHLICATIADSSPCESKLKDFIGTNVRFSGIRLEPSETGWFGTRKMLGFRMSSNGMDSLTQVSPLPSDWSVLPTIGSISARDREAISKLNLHRVSGLVLASWDTDLVLLQTQAGDICQIRILGERKPDFGTSIEAIGFPETDLYRLNLANARWKPTKDLGLVQPLPSRISGHDIFTDRQGRYRILSSLHGRMISLRGTVKETPIGDSSRRILLSCDGYTITLDCNAVPSVASSIQTGSELEASGTCVLETSQGDTPSLVPRITSVMLFVHDADDIRLVRSPPWWTPVRMSILIGVLIAILFAILVWNLVLHHLVERRGKLLAAGEIARAEADIKTIERTRLSVELHDALSQTLTGVALELETADQLKSKDPQLMFRHLGRARQTLESCRTELKNCLWDLRNDALEVPDMNQAIRMTLIPYTKNVNVRIRVMVPREMLTDNSMHAILRILRELCVNAINHGHATELLIAGSIEGDMFKFSVTDNGTGFDPESAPGVAEGHFGLEGIRERIRALRGKIVFVPAVRGGCKAIATVRLFSLQTPSLST